MYGNWVGFRCRKRWNFDTCVAERRRCFSTVDIGVLYDLRHHSRRSRPSSSRHGLQAMDIGVLDDLRPSFSPLKAFKLRYGLQGGYRRSGRLTAIILALKLMARLQAVDIGALDDLPPSPSPR